MTAVLLLVALTASSFHTRSQPHRCSGTFLGLVQILTWSSGFSKNDWYDTTLTTLIFFINMDLVFKKIPHVLCYQWALENMLAAAEAPWPLFKQMAMKWFDAVPVHVPAGKHTSSIIGATQVPHTISKFIDSNSPFSYYGPKFRTLKTCYQNCDNKNVSKFLKMQECDSSKRKPDFTSRGGFCTTAPLLSTVSR